MERTPFKLCPGCRAKFPRTNLHEVCNLCLSLEHDEKDCEACRSFRSKKTICDRRARRHEMRSGSIPDIFGEDSDSHRPDPEPEEEELVSVSEADSDMEEELIITPGQRTMSTDTQVPNHPKSKGPVSPSPSGSDRH